MKAFHIPVLFVLNVFDVAFTLILTNQPGYYEANLIAAAWLRGGPQVFIFFKFVFAGLACAVFWEYWDYFIARVGCNLATIVYSGVVAWEIYNIARVITGS